MTEPAASDRRWYLKLLAIPFVWQVALVPFANAITLRPVGLPFAMAWQMAGIVIAATTIAIVHRLDLRREARLGIDEDGL